MYLCVWVSVCVRICVRVCLFTLLCLWLPAFPFLIFSIYALLYLRSLCMYLLYFFQICRSSSSVKLTTTFSPAIFSCSVSGSFMHLLISECFLVCWTCLSFLEVFCQIFRFYFLVSLHILQLLILSPILFIIRFESLFLFVDVFFFSFYSNH